MTQHVHLLVRGARKVTETLKSHSHFLRFAVISHPQPLNASLFCTSKGDVRRMDAAVWALLSNSSSSRGRAASPPFSSKHSSKSSSTFTSSSSLYPSSRVSASSSSARWSSRDLSPPLPQSDVSSSVRPSKPQHYSPGHAPRLQVLTVKIALRSFSVFSNLR